MFLPLPRLFFVCLLVLFLFVIVRQKRVIEGETADLSMAFYDAQLNNLALTQMTSLHLPSPMHAIGLTQAKAMHAIYVRRTEQYLIGTMEPLTHKKVERKGEKLK